MPNPLPVSQEAREAAEVAFDDVLGDAGSYAEYMLPSHREGGVRTLAEAFARFEQAIRKDEAEKCARVADSYDEALSPPPGWSDDWKDGFETGACDNSIAIAAALRARHAEPHTDQTGGK